MFMLFRKCFIISAILALASNLMLSPATRASWLDRTAPCPQYWYSLVKGAPCIPNLAQIPMVNPPSPPPSDQHSTPSVQWANLAPGVWFWSAINSQSALTQKWIFRDRSGFLWAANNLWKQRIQEAQALVLQQPDNHVYKDMLNYAMARYKETIQRADETWVPPPASHKSITSPQSGCDYAWADSWITGSQLTGEGQACAQSQDPYADVDIQLCNNNWEDCEELSDHAHNPNATSFAALEAGRGGVPRQECRAIADASADWNNCVPRWPSNKQYDHAETYDDNCQ